MKWTDRRLLARRDALLVERIAMQGNDDDGPRSESGRSSAGRGAPMLPPQGAAPLGAAPTLMPPAAAMLPGFQPLSSLASAHPLSPAPLLALGQPALGLHGQPHLDATGADAAAS